MNLKCFFFGHKVDMQYYWPVLKDPQNWDSYPLLCGECLAYRPFYKMRIRRK